MPLEQSTCWQWWSHVSLGVVREAAGGDVIACGLLVGLHELPDVPVGLLEVIEHFPYLVQLCMESCAIGERVGDELGVGWVLAVYGGDHWAI